MAIPYVQLYVRIGVTVNPLLVNVGKLHTSFIAEIAGHSKITMNQVIDGAKHAHVIRHRVGVRVKDVYEVRKIDDSYFAE
jgi:hypothetical protein